MMKKFLLLFLLAAVLGSCSRLKVATVKENSFGETIYMYSSSLKKNKINDDGLTGVDVILPDSYSSSQKKYPVVYYFHGYGGSKDELSRWGILTEIKDYLSKSDRQFILVCVNAVNKFGGCFYADSSVTGMWEQYFIKELIPLVDKRYRTIDNAGSRGLMGFSMGGFGVLHIGLNYSKYFKVVWSQCPGVFVPEKGLKDAMPTWSSLPRFKTGYGSTFAEDGESVPKFDGTSQDKKLVSLWESGFGGWNERIIKYKSDKGNIKFRIAYAKYDNYAWIIEGSKYLADEFRKQGIDSEINGYDTGHTLSPELFRVDALPFMIENLDY